MKLKTFDATNVVSTRSTKPAVSINSKSGLFAFNKGTCEKIGLKGGDMVKFHQDEADETNWYLEKVEKDGFLIRSREDVKSVFFNNASMVRKIFDSLAYIKNYGTVGLGEVVKFEKRKLFTLITAGLKND